MDSFEGLEGYEKAIRAELQGLVSTNQSQLFGMMRYHMSWEDQEGGALSRDEGKRLRPLLCLLACEALGGDYERALPAAAAVELVHNFSLVHDDIQDGSPTRSNRPAVWWLWGASQAINAGDAFYALGRLAIFKLHERGLPYEKVLKAAQLLDEACLQLCEGQYLDIQFQSEFDTSMESYLRMVEGKTGALFRCALQCGALVASDAEPVIEAVGNAGMKLGYAFQIRNDWTNLWGAASNEQERASDLHNRKKSFPIVHALHKAQGKEKTELVSYLQRLRLQDEEVAKLISLLEAMDIKEESLQIANRYQLEAIAALEQTGFASPTLERLKAFAGFVAEHPE